MARRSRRSRHDDKVDSYHTLDMWTASLITKALHRAEEGIAEDIQSLLQSFQYRGGFKTREAAQAFLDRPIPARSYTWILERAAKMPRHLARRFIERMGAPSTKAAIDHKEAVRMVLQMNEHKLVQAITGQADPFLKKTITEAYGRQSFEIQKGMNVAFNVDMPTTGAVREIATKALPKSTTTKMAGQVTEDLRAKIIEMMLQGKPTYDIAEQVSKGTGQEVWKAKRLVRTIITEASAEAELTALKDSGFDEYEYIATKDERTCPVCGRLDGKIFQTDRKKVGINFPPMHPNCRCTVAVVLEDWEKEGHVKAARDREGKNITIPAGWTYEDWAKEYYPKGYKRMKKGPIIPE